MNNLFPMSFGVFAIFLIFIVPAQASDVAYGLFIKEGSIFEPYHDNWSFGEDGSVGKSWQTDAFWLKKCPFPVEFRCHFKQLGWTEWKSVGDYKTSLGKRLEAVEFRFPKGEPETFGYVFMGRVHVQGIGWMAPTRIHAGVCLGTTNKEARLEAIQLAVEKIVP